MKNYLTLSVLVVLTSFLLFPIHYSHAATYDLKDQNSCQSISGTWNPSTSTCTLSTLNLNSGDSLTVDNSVFADISLAITDTVNNGGLINNSGNVIINNSGVLNNNGSFLNYCTGNCIDGIIQNNGIITNNKGGTITSNSTIDNSGPINNSGTIIIQNGGTITNSAKLINNLGGVINNSGVIHNNELSAIINNGGIVINYATLINDVGGTVTNSGTMKNMCGGTFTSNGDLLGNPVNNTSCATQKSSTVPEFPFAIPILVISFLSMIVFYKRLCYS